VTVYISEAHPGDEWQMDSNVKESFVFNQPKTFDERKALAKVLVERLQYRMPVAIDSIDDQVGKLFAAWPERIYILGSEGRVLYKGEMGPFGFHPEEAEKVLATLVPPAAPAVPSGPSQ
jgi:hypothetical protein